MKYDHTGPRKCAVCHEHNVPFGVDWPVWKNGMSVCVTCQCVERGAYCAEELHAWGEDGPGPGTTAWQIYEDTLGGARFSLRSGLWPVRYTRDAVCFALNVKHGTQGYDRVAIGLEGGQGFRVTGSTMHWVVDRFAECTLGPVVEIPRGEGLRLARAVCEYAGITIAGAV